MSDHPVLKTSRLVLSPMTIGETEALIASASDPELKNAYSEMLEGILADPDALVWNAPWKICLRSDPDSPIGDAGFKGRPVKGGVEIGYGIEPAFEGKGYMTEAADALVHWALGMPGVEKVYAETAPDNRASQRILEKLFFLPCGEGEEGPRFVRETAKLTVCSFNIQHCCYFPEKRIDYKPFIASIRSLSPDLLGLNEVRGEGSGEGFDPQTHILSEGCGMTGVFAKAIDVGDKGPYGNAFLSKHPILSYEIIPIPDPSPRGYSGYYETRCLLKTVVSVGGIPLTVLVCHFGLNPDEQENAVKTVLANLPDRRCVLMGDFNVTPDRSVLSPLRARLTDATSLRPDEAFPTFPSDAPDRRIDYIFVSPDLSVRSVTVPPLVVSDHRPILASILL